MSGKHSRQIIAWFLGERGPLPPPIPAPWLEPGASLVLSTLNVDLAESTALCTRHTKHARVCTHGHASQRTCNAHTREHTPAHTMHITPHSVCTHTYMNAHTYNHTHTTHMHRHVHTLTHGAGEKAWGPLLCVFAFLCASVLSRLQAGWAAWPLPAGPAPLGCTCISQDPQGSAGTCPLSRGHRVKAWDRQALPV